MVDYGGWGPAQPVDVVVVVLVAVLVVVVVDPESAGIDDDVVDVDDVDVAVDVGGATPVSGETHPAGGDVAPDCPGMSTVPAHPKSENVASLAVVEPSVKCATDRVCRI